MPDPLNDAQQQRPKKSTGRLLLELALERNATGVVITAGDYARKQVVREIEALVNGGGAGEDKLPGDAALPKKVAQEVGQYILPSRYIKALTEIGEGEIPFTDKPGNRPGLGKGEEGRIQAETEAYRKKLAEQQSAARAELVAIGVFARTVSAGAISATPVALLPTLAAGGPVAAALAREAGTIASGVLAAAPGAADPPNALVQAALLLAKGIVKDLVTERADP